MKIKQEKTRYFLHFDSKTTLLSDQIHILAVKIKQEKHDIFYIFQSKTTFLSDQIHISGLKVNKNVFFDSKMKKNRDFCIENRFLALYA